MKYTAALVGNPNAGKTTLFNALTGSSAHVGNWPGVTVEKKEGVILGDKSAKLLDLPGIYSLSPYSPEEVLAREYLLQEKPDVIINIVDLSNLERNLLLTSQILEMGIPTVIAANMMDVLEKRGDSFSSAKLSEILGVPVVEISALEGEGLEQLISVVEKQAASGDVPNFKIDLGVKANRLVEEFEEKVRQTIPSAYSTNPENPSPEARIISPTFCAIKILERDKKAMERFPLSPSEEQKITEIEELTDDDSEAFVTKARYQYISSIISDTYIKHKGEDSYFTDRVDAIVTNKYLALPIFALIIFAVYYLSINAIGGALTDYVNETVVAEWAQGGALVYLESLGASPWLVDLIVNGIIAGVGAVLGFLPQMAVLFFFLAILEQCGYMARVAFILDQVFRKFGLSGKSFIPMLIGTGCSVPGIMATRTIENEGDRRATAIITSFMPCSAKLPIIAFIAGAFFNQAWWFAPLCYFIGIIAIIISGVALKKMSIFYSEPAPFIMELPEYRIPRAKGVFMTVWERCAAFAKKAGTVILLSAIVLWFLQAYTISAEGIVSVNGDLDKSILARMGNALAWLFAPLGFGDWQSTVAIITGLIAKENVMTSFAVLYGVSGDALSLIESGNWGALQSISSHYSAISGFSFLIFNLLCAPCFAAIGAMRKELGTAKWTLFGLGYQSIFAYSISLIFYQAAQFIHHSKFTLGTLAALIVLVYWLYLIYRKPTKGRGILLDLVISNK